MLEKIIIVLLIVFAIVFLLRLWLMAKKNKKACGHACKCGAEDSRKAKKTTQKYNP